MSENFLSRWSKRKLEVREQEKLVETTALESGKSIVQPANAQEGSLTTQAKLGTTADISEPVVPPPTEADLQAVEQGGDIKAFLVDKVSQDLKNKAFKALFSRPEFNVMDGLDIYIDDYSKFTPLSQEDIGKMTFSKQLLSRPDLDLPKTGDIQENLQALMDKVPEAEKSPEPVPDYHHPDESADQSAEENPDSIRVIPDSSQAIDLEENSTERSFKSPIKNPR